MFCGKCGAKCEPGATFCGTCGAPLEPEKVVEHPINYGNPAENIPSVPVQGTGKYKKIGIIAVAAVAVLAVFAIFSLFGGRSDKATAERFFDAVFDADTEAIVDLLPKDLVNAAMEAGGYDKEDVAEEFAYLSNALKSSIGFLDLLGDGVKFSYDAVSSEDVTEDRLSYLQERYQEIGVDVSAARTVCMEFRVQVDSFGVDETNTLDIPVIKVGRSWYLDVMGI